MKNTEKMDIVAIAKPNPLLLSANKNKTIPQVVQYDTVSTMT